MALEHPDTARNRTPLYMGIAAVALVVVLGIVAVSGRDEPGMAPAPTVPEQGPGNAPGTVEGGSTNAPVLDGTTAPIDPAPAPN